MICVVVCIYNQALRYSFQCLSDIVWDGILYTSHSRRKTVLICVFVKVFHHYFTARYHPHTSPCHIFISTTYIPFQKYASFSHKNQISSFQINDMMICYTFMYPTLIKRELPQSFDNNNIFMSINILA